MKKLLLSILSVAAMSFAANADTTIDFTALDVWAPEGTALEKLPMTSNDASATEAVFTVNEVKVGLTNCYMLNSNSNGKITAVNGLLMAYNKTPKGEVTFTLPFDCSGFTATTTSGCSENAGNKVKVYAGDTQISEGTNGMEFNVRNKAYNFTLTGDAQKAGTVYKIAAAGNKNPQIAKIVFKAVTAEPSLTANVTDVALYTVKGGEAEATIKVTAANVTGDITATTDVEGLTFDKATYTQAEAAEGIVVKYTGTTAGQNDGKITFTVGTTTAEVTASCYAAAQEGTKDMPLTVAEVLALKSNCAGNYWVKGIIADKTAKSSPVDGKIADNAEVQNTNIILEDEGGNRIAVQLPAGDIRNALNIVSNPTNAGKTVSIYGSLENYCGVPGVKSPSDYVLEVSNAIDSIVADDAAEAEYYNLQGVRVAAPESGLYIVRRGNKVTKELVK